MSRRLSGGTNFHNAWTANLRPACGYLSRPQGLAGLGREAEASEKRAGALGSIHEIGGLFEDQSLRKMYLEDATKKLG